MIFSHMSSPLNPAAPSAMSPCETLRRIGTEIEALMSDHNRLQLHKRAIERQLASIAAQIHAHNEVLTPRDIFLLLEIRGSGGVNEQLEQIAHILHEDGYWKPRGRVQHYAHQDVYHLGKSAQQLFDDFAVLDRRVEQFRTRLASLQEHQQMVAEMTPQEVFDCLATTKDVASFQSELDALVDLLEPARRRGWFSWLFGPRGRKKLLRPVARDRDSQVA